MLAVLCSYFGYLSWKYDIATGGLVSALTWSFFVLCTPIADAGFLLDFPVRLITGMRMFFTEMVVWALAITINSFTLLYDPQSYQMTFLTSLLYKILTTPWPYWSIIALCAVGTFLSVRFGDEVIDTVSHKKDKNERTGVHGFFKRRFIAIAALVLLIIWTYYHLLETLNIDLKSI